MERFTWNELSDMHLALGAADTSEGARRLCEQRSPNRHLPNRRTLDAVDRRISERGTVEGDINARSRQRGFTT